ncbi:MAG: sigma-70 family RNA polymerase sigma factor [candidate division Zixibacteria bacterium]|nr:sigma-70 family RNA polymerase sigma factor [candidate division Zixibacteria bacterium]
MDNKGDHNQFDDSQGRIADSTEKDFMGLILSNQKRLFGYIITMVPNYSDAEDILQDTMTIMWQKFHQFERGSNFVAWGISIARYRIMKYRERRAHTKLKLDKDVFELLEKRSGPMLDTLSARLDALKDCIKKLTGKEIDFIKMRYQEDLSFQKIASSVGLSVSGVFKAVSQVHYKLILCMRRSRVLDEVS